MPRRVSDRIHTVFGSFHGTCGVGSRMDGCSPRHSRVSGPVSTMKAMLDRRRPEEFGANSWLVEEMYERFRDDPKSVGENWREFFSDFKPEIGRAHV